MSKVDGIDYTPEGIRRVREDLIQARDKSYEQWPEAIPFTVLASHIIALLADYAEMKETKDGSNSG